MEISEIAKGEIPGLTKGVWKPFYCETYHVDNNGIKTKIPESELNPLWVVAYDNNGKRTELCKRAVTMSESGTKNWKNEARLFAQAKKLLIHAIMVKFWFEHQYEKGRMSGDDFLFSKELIEKASGIPWEILKKEAING